jgi:hypothetical protein
MFQDSESKAYFLYYSTSLEIQQSNDLEKCQNMINLALKHLHNSTQLSYDSQVLFLRLKILLVDINCSLLIRNQQSANYLNDLLKSLFVMHEYVLEKLRVIEGK